MGGGLGFCSVEVFHKYGERIVPTIGELHAPHVVVGGQHAVGVSEAGTGLVCHADPRLIGQGRHDAVGAGSAAAQVGDYHFPVGWMEESPVGKQSFHQQCGSQRRSEVAVAE